MVDSSSTQVADMRSNPKVAVAVRAKIEKELIKGIVHLARHKEFYGHIVQQLQKVYVSSEDSCKTAGVGRIAGERFIKMYFNVDFFTDILASAGDREKGWAQMLAVIEHEICHIIFGHLFLHFADRTRGSVAEDCVVNSLIPKNTLPGEYVHPENYGLPLNKSAMWYYAHLQDNPEYKKQCAEGKLGIGGVLSNVMSGHSKWEDLKDDLVAKEFAKDIVRKAQDLCGKNYGNIPGEIIDQIENLLKKERAIVPWGKVLRMFCASCAESNLDYTVKRISKRFATRPGTRKEDVLNLAVAVDTSGSISDQMLKIFFNEIRWIWKNGAKITVYEADCRVCATYPFKGKFTGKVHGRGGTELEPALKEVEGKHDAVVYFTDFYAPKIEKRYRIPTLWVLTTELEKSEWPVKWGKHIKIDDGKAVAV
jgi:predicted metal-dependent peptidase